MELYKEILVALLEKGKLNLVCSDISLNLDELLEKECYKALVKIKDILEDETLKDNECFMKIEKIVCAFETLGSAVEYRHDFG